MNYCNITPRTVGPLPLNFQFNIFQQDYIKLEFANNQTYTTSQTSHFLHLSQCKSMFENYTSINIVSGARLVVE